MRPHGIMFHHFRSANEHTGDGSISADQFARTIEQFGPRRILPARQWMRCALTATLRPTDVCLTFDGNLLSQYEVALPVLRSFGMTAFWFVPTPLRHGTAERRDADRVNDQQIKHLHSIGHVVGLHPNRQARGIKRLTRDQQRQEYQQNFDYLHALLGEAPEAVSHPCNSYNRDTLGILRELGISLGFRADMEGLGGSELEYPREDHANLLPTALAA